MASPLFTVVVPTFGRPVLLREAIASVLTQTVTDVECLVVDDASPEPPDLDSDPRIRLLRRSTNGGPAASRNTGLEAARGRYLSFLDDDDLYEPNRLEMVLAALAHTPVAVCHDVGVRGEKGDRRQLEGDVRDSILDTTAPHLGKTSLRREVAPRFDERFRCSEDSEWWLRLAATASVTTVDEVGFRYRRHGGARHQLGASERTRGNLLLLDVHSRYFDTHPRAAAFRWKRVGMTASSAGDHALARRSFTRSIQLRPAARTFWLLAKELRASTSTVDPRQPSVAWP